MPKILRIINRFNLGGPTYNATLLTRHLPPEYETMLIGGPNEDSEESSLHIPQKLGIEPHIVNSMQRAIHPWKDWQAYREISSIIRKFRPDIVHTHASKAGAVGRLAALSNNVPIVVHTFHGHVFHSYFGRGKTSFYKNMERYLASKSHSIIAISDQQKMEIGTEHKICSPDKISVINLGFDLSVFRRDMDAKRAAFRKQYRLNEDELAIGIIGRLVPIKNHKMFIKAWQEVLDKSRRKVKAFIIGDGDEKESILAFARSAGITANTEAGTESSMIFTSWIKDIDFALAGLDIVALTSLNEGTPVSIIEAQASGKPVVSTNVGGISDIVIPNETALLSNSNDHHQLAGHLLKLIHDETLRKKMETKGWEFVKDRFSVENLARRMSSHYRELLERSGR